MLAVPLATSYEIHFESLYSPHMVVKYNKNSNRTKNKRETYNVNTSERTRILRPDDVKKSTQQSLCINFVRRRSSATLGSAKLNCSWHCFTRAISDVLNSFINCRLITKSNDCVWVFVYGACFKVVQQDWDACALYEL